MTAEEATKWEAARTEITATKKKTFSNSTNQLLEYVLVCQGF